MLVRCTQPNETSSMARKPTNSFIVLLITLIVCLTLQQCDSNTTKKSFILDNVEYEVNNGGIGYDVKSDNELDLNKKSFIATIHITNLSKMKIKLDTLNFKLLSEPGIPIPLQTKIGGSDVSAMYKLEIEPGKSSDYLLTFSIPKEGHYNLHIISPISKKEKVLYY